MHSVRLSGNQQEGAPEKPKHGDSPPLAVGLNLVKCAVGAGSFSLPAAWKAAGFWAAAVLTSALGALAVATAIMLVQSEKRMSAAVGRRLTYPELLLATFPGRVGVLLHAVAVFGICFTSVGVCVAYVDFIVGVLTSLLKCAASEAMLLLAPFVLLLALLRSFRFLAFTSILGDIAVLAGLIGTVVFGVTQGAHFTSPTELPAVHLPAVPQAAGNVAFLFLIHVVVLPIAQSLRPSAEEELPSVNDSSSSPPWPYGPPPRPRGGKRWCTGFAAIALPSYAIITLANLAFAAVCYCLFGSSTADNVLENLTQGSAGVVGIQLLLCVDLLFTIPMVLAAGRELLEGYAMSTSFGEHHETLTRTLTRACLVGLIFALAAAIPSFGDAVSLIGGLANALMGLVLPPLLYSPTRLAPVHAISLFGLVLLVSSTFFTIKGMVA